MDAQRNGLAPAWFLPIVVRGALSKAWTAFRENRLPLSPRWWLQALFLHWTETRASLEAISPSAGLDRARLDASYNRWLLDRTQRDAEEVRGPHLSVTALVDELAHVDAVIQSVALQSFEDWDLSLIPLRWRPEYEGVLKGHPKQSRIRIVSLDEITRPDGTWLPPGTGETVVFLDPQSLLAPDALERIARIAECEPDAWIYTDDDLLDSAGRRSDPNLKGAFSPELALVDDYASRVAVSPRRAIVDAGGLRPAYAGAQIYELFLRVVDAGTGVEHLADVCCHRRTRVPPVLTDTHRRAASEALARRGAEAEVVPEPDGKRKVPSQRVRWHKDPDAAGVTIVIPTRDRVDLLRACVSSLRQTVDMTRVEVLIVDDQSRQPDTLTFLADFERRTGCRVLRTAAESDTFNYSRLMNLAAREVNTPLMLHLNNDIEAITPGWLEQMQGWFTLPGIGVVGPKLLYPDGAIQHAGVMVVPGLFTPEHLFHHLPNDDPGYQWLPHRLRNVSAVTGACVLTRTALFREVGGFDEEHLQVQFNDIDYCLRVIARGKRVVYEPAAVLYHRTSASRGEQFDYRETLYFLGKYRDLTDPFISPNVEPLSMLGHTPALKARA